MTTKQIEAAAKALHAQERRRLGTVPWEDAPPDLKTYWRDCARTVLDAAAQETPEQEHLRSIAHSLRQLLQVYIARRP
jgi:hypothetical protein